MLNVILDYIFEYIFLDYMFITDILVILYLRDPRLLRLFRLFFCFFFNLMRAEQCCLYHNGTYNVHETPFYLL